MENHLFRKSRESLFIIWGWVGATPSQPQGKSTILIYTPCFLYEILPLFPRKSLLMSIFSIDFLDICYSRQREQWSELNDTSTSYLATYREGDYLIFNFCARCEHWLMSFVARRQGKQVRSNQIKHYIYMVTTTHQENMNLEKNQSCIPHLSSNKKRSWAREERKNKQLSIFQIRMCQILIGTAPSEAISILPNSLIEVLFYRRHTSRWVCIPFADEDTKLLLQFCGRETVAGNPQGNAYAGSTILPTT